MMIPLTLRKAVSAAFLGGAILIGMAGATNARAAQVSQRCPSDAFSVVQASALFRGVARCARTPACRKQVAMRTERMAKRLVKLMTDLATDTMEQISELVGSIKSTPDNAEAIARLDRLESLLRQDDALTDEIKNEIEGLRAALRT